jgi:T5SS/PEP-CTERM-associated repeat protein
METMTTTFTWANGVSGDWGAASDWTPAGGPPDANNVAAIISAAGGYTVTISSTETVGAVVINASGAELSIASGGALVLAGTSPSLLLSAGTFDLAGTLIGGTLAASGGTTLIENNSTLDGVTWQGSLAIAPNINLNVLGGLTAETAAGTQPGTIDMSGGAAALFVLDSETLNNMTIELGGTGGDILLNYNTAGGTVTLGGGFVLNQSGGFNELINEFDGDAITNAGQFNVNGGELTVFFGNFTNSGTILVNNGGTVDLSLSATLTNSGTISVGSASDLIVGTVAASTGGLTINGGTIEFTTTVAANTTFSSTGGELLLDVPAAYTGTIHGFAASDTIVLSPNIFSSAGTTHLLTGNTLQVVENGQTVALKLDPAQNFSGATFHLSLDANNVSTDVTVVGPPVPQAIAKLNTPGPLTLANQHVGATPLTDTLSISNAATPPAEGLDITIAGTTGAATGAGVINLLAAGATDSSDMRVGISTGAAGARAGTVILNQYTDGSVTDGAGKSLIGTSTVTVSGSVFNLATASAVAPNPVNFGAHHVGDAINQALSVSNTGTAGGFTENLDATIGGVSGGASASGTIIGLAPGKTDNASLIVGLSSAAAGTVSGSAIIAFNSDGTGVDGLGTTAIAPQTIVAITTLYNLAAPTLLPTTLNFGAGRVGDSLPGVPLSISNGTTVSAFQESLAYNVGGAPPGFSASSGGSGTVASGGSTAATLTLSTATSGNFNNSTIAVGLTSTGIGTSGLANTLLTTQSILLNGEVFATAVAQPNNTSLNFGVVHVGDAVNQTLTITNIAIGALTDVLTGGFSTVTGPFNGTGNLGAGLAAGAVGTLTVGLNTANAGLVTGSAALSLASHDSLLSDAAVTAGPIGLNGTIDNYATAALEKTSGAGTFIQTGTETGPLTGNNTYTLDFGVVLQGATIPTASLVALNAATGLADLMQGNFQLSGTTGFTNTGFGPFTGLGFGQTGTALTISLSTGTVGGFAETVTLTASGTNASGYTGAIASDIVTVTGTVIAPARTLVWTGRANTNFANAANWNDTTSGLDPASVAPDATDTVEFDSFGGAISNTGTVATINVGGDGSGALQLNNGVTLTAGSLDVGVAATAVGQIGLTGLGTELSITGAATVADDGTGVLSVLSGATFSAANLTIGSRGNSSGAVVVSGFGSEVNLTGALSVGTSLGTGDLTVGPGAAVHASLVDLRGQVVLEGGLLDPTVTMINQGQTAGGFGTLVADNIVDEGVIQAGGSNQSQKLLLVRGTVLGGGSLSRNGTALATSPVGLLRINAGGTLELSGPVLNAATTTFTDALTQTGTYAVNNSVVDVSFADATGVLLLDDIGGFAGTIASFTVGDQIVITGGTLSNMSVTNTNTLTFTDAGPNAGIGGVDQIVFRSPVTADRFNIVGGGTVQAVAAVACFAEGTRIETVDGPVAVEALSIGDWVMTADGREEPIVRIVRGPLDCDRHPRPQTVWPVRIRAGAFGRNVPEHDLYLSPDHAVFVNGVLVPARFLVNGSGIAQVAVPNIVYFHVELPEHEVVLAEGLEVESYLNVDGDRFDTRGVMRLCSPRSASLTAWTWETRGIGPLVLTGNKLSEARAVTF